jgi:hypothetical protein
MNLYHVLRRFEQCCKEVECLLNEAIAVQNTNERAFLTYSAQSVIKLHDFWTTHCRQLVLYSCREGTTLSGNLLSRSPVLPSGADPVEWLRGNWTRQGKRMGSSWEPDWHVPDQCLRAAELLRIANYSTVFNALSAVLVADQLRVTRNAIVHSLPVTYSRFRVMEIALGFTGKVPPLEFIFYRIGGSGPMLIDVWISELRLCIAAAIR